MGRTGLELSVRYSGVDFWKNSEGKLSDTSQITVLSS